MLRLANDLDLGPELLVAGDQIEQNPQTLRGKIAALTPRAGNSKTGRCVNTYAAQRSCPDGQNNAASYACPYRHHGCYAERGRVAMITRALNQAADEQKATPLEIAEAEAALLEYYAATPDWARLKSRPHVENVGVRLHVVGDCVTPETAQLVGRAASKLYVPLGQRYVRNIWVYTRGWRSVQRNDWPDQLSVIASADTWDDVELATRRNYACALIIPREVALAGQRSSLRYRNYKLLCCPYELGINIQCIKCQICLREQLWVGRAVICFLADGPRAEQRAKELIPKTSIEEVGPASHEF